MIILAHEVMTRNKILIRLICSYNEKPVKTVSNIDGMNIQFIGCTLNFCFILFLNLRQTYIWD